MYCCPRCGSTEFAIDEQEEIKYTKNNKIAKVNIQYDVMCRNCGEYQGGLKK